MVWMRLAALLGSCPSISSAFGGSCLDCSTIRRRVVSSSQWRSLSCPRRSLVCLRMTPSGTRSNLASHGFKLFAWWRVIPGSLGLIALALAR
jgi:hypothetical protein